MDNLLEIKDLTVDLMTTRGVVRSLRGVNLDIRPGEIHGLVGESGCGKSMTSKSILRLHNEQRSRMSGEILFEGKDILKLDKKEMQALRGARISMIFQDPMTSLNPLLTIGEQVAEMFRVHQKADKKTAKMKALTLLEKVGINPPEKRYNQYPFELSGGLLQRVMIAAAISCNPSLLIADEPTTALDVTIQAQILDLLKELQKDMGMSILLITHNFGIVAEICDRVSVMYAGKIVETCDTKSIFKDARHPYSRALIGSIPKAGEKQDRLATIAGSPPELFEDIDGCAFAPRCGQTIQACYSQCPELASCDKSGAHVVDCHCMNSCKEAAK